MCCVHRVPLRKWWDVRVPLGLRISQETTFFLHGDLFLQKSRISASQLFYHLQASPSPSIHYPSDTWHLPLQNSFITFLFPVPLYHPEWQSYSLIIPLNYKFSQPCDFPLNLSFLQNRISEPVFCVLYVYHTHLCSFFFSRHFDLLLCLDSATVKILIMTWLDVCNCCLTRFCCLCLSSSLQSILSTLSPTYLLNTYSW